MRITKTYKFKLRLTKPQEATIHRWIQTCCYLYNVAKEAREEGYRNGKPINYYGLAKQLTDVRAEFDWVRELPAQTEQDVLERLESAYQNFFSGRAKYPRWAKKGKYNSITFKSVKVDTHNRVKLPKIGSLKYFASQELVGELRRATIIEEADGYYICILTKQEIVPIEVPNENQVGIDMGISYFAVTSGGEYIENPHFLKNSLGKMRVEQRSLARKRQGSNSRAEQKVKVARLHQTVRRQRMDFLHKLSTRVVQDNNLIVVEDLNIKELAKSSVFSGHISDVAWGEFHRQLEYKSQWNGRDFIKVDPAYTSQECSHCGHIDEENRLTQSQFCCMSCGHLANADEDAAKVILGRGTTDVSKRRQICQA